VAHTAIAPWGEQQHVSLTPAGRQRRAGSGAAPVAVQMAQDAGERGGDEPRAALAHQHAHLLHLRRRRTPGSSQGLVTPSSGDYKKFAP
jgi:hypothetical protein